VAVQIPLYLQNKLIPAKFDRQLISDLFDSIEQVVGDNDLLVTAAGGLVTATAAGRCVVQGDTNPNQGMYRCFNDASVSRTHVASGVNPKIDRLVMKVHDSVETGSGTDLADIEIVAGTPISSADINNPAHWPAIPPSAMPIARVLVPTSGPIATIADERPLRRHISAGLAQQLGLNDAGIVRRGKSITPTQETRDSAVSGTGYGTLTTPDQVQSVVLPTDGLIFVAFQGMWKESVAGAARAAIFIGANQTKLAYENQTAPPSVEALINNATNVYTPLASAPHGLVSGDASAAYAGDATTGQMVGVEAARWHEASGSSQLDRTTAGVAMIFADAGTYNVSVQFKVSSGTVTAKNRKLWCWTQG
jgi:hypothetical protein